jgi:hypothetical protein
LNAHPGGNFIHLPLGVYVPAQGCVVVRPERKNVPQLRIHGQKHIIFARGTAAVV